VDEETRELLRELLGEVRRQRELAEQVLSALQGPPTLVSFQERITFPFADSVARY
jgi:hypothetical protein